jgi:hypothetical protein
MDLHPHRGGFLVAVVVIALIVLLWISIREYVSRRPGRK